MDSISGTQVAGGIVGVLCLILTLYTLIDALRKPSQAYEHAGVSKGSWVILLVLSLFIRLRDLPHALVAVLHRTPGEPPRPRSAASASPTDACTTDRHGVSDAVGNSCGERRRLT